MRLTLRNKLLLFFILIALIPLGVAGWNLIKITKDELKSAANNELSNTALQISNEIDNYYINTWAAPLLLIRDAVDSGDLSVEQKISMLALGVEEVADVELLQLMAADLNQPIYVMDQQFSDILNNAGIKADRILFDTAYNWHTIEKNEKITVGELDYIEETSHWLISMIIPLREELGGRRAWLAAKINLNRLQNTIEKHPYAKSNRITIMDSDGFAIFDKIQPDLKRNELAGRAVELIKGGSRVVGVHHYENPDGELMLGAHSFPQYLDWGILVEKSERNAYLAVSKMEQGLLLWIVFGLAVAVVTAVVVAYSLTKPIRRLMTAAGRLSGGDFTVQIEGLKRRDEIGELSNSFQKMVIDLQNYIYELTETTKQKERVDSELRLARDIQQSFIPHEFPDLEVVEFWGKCEPAREVGGDFIDYIRMDEHRIGFAIGDVSGKGVPAALFMSMYRVLFRVICTQVDSPDQVLLELNRKILEVDPSGSMFITLFYGIYDCRTGIFSYSNAGHNMPFVKLTNKVGENGGFEMLPRIKTMVAGMMEDISLELAELKLDPGDVIVFYTDGLTEAMNIHDEEYGEERLKKLLSEKFNLSAEKICVETIQTILRYQSGRMQFDDMTMLALKIHKIGECS